MPYKTEKIRYDNPFLDARTKLLPCQKEMVYYWYLRGMSKRKIAKMFNVSRRLIDFIVDPEKHEENIARRQAKGGSKIYYNRDKFRETMKTFRKRKHTILTKFK